MKILLLIGDLLSFQIKRVVRFRGTAMRILYKRQGDDRDRSIGGAAESLHVRIRLRHVWRPLRWTKTRQDTQIEEWH